MQAADLTSITRKTEKWFARHQRPLPWRDRYDPYRVWVSEVMLQQTRMEVVLPYYAAFLTRFPTLRALAAATEDEVTAAWSGLGYYRRARMLREGAAAVVQRFRGRIPHDVDALQSLPGIGRYTAGAIASIGFNERAPIVDGNVARVLTRLFGAENDSWARADALVRSCKTPRAFNQGLMEIGALICTPRNPACLACPLRAECATKSDALPRAKAKKATRAMRIDLYLVTDRKGRVLMRRESGPLMDAMYHLPHGDTSLLTGKPLHALRRDLLGSFRHTVTNRRIEFALYRCGAGDLAGARQRNTFAWIHPDDLASVPHPSYVRKALRLASGKL